MQKCMLSCIMSLSADGLTSYDFQSCVIFVTEIFFILEYLHCFRFVNCFASKQLGVLIRILQFEGFSSYQCL